MTLSLVSPTGHVVYTYDGMTPQFKTGTGLAINMAAGILVEGLEGRVRPQDAGFHEAFVKYVKKSKNLEKYTWSTGTETSGSAKKTSAKVAEAKPGTI